MKNLVFALLLSLLTFRLVAQDIREIQAYDKTGGTRVIALKTDNTGKWYTEKSGWKPLPSGELPAGKVRMVDSYLILAGLSIKTRLIAVMEDNNVWWTVNDKWEKADTKGLPAKAQIVGIEAYVESGLYGATTNYLVVALDNNSVWRFTKKKGWLELPGAGLPEGQAIDVVQSFQVMKGMTGMDVRIVVKTADNSIYWLNEKKKAWIKYGTDGLPENAYILRFEAFMKYKPMGSPTGRLLVVLPDNTIWWSSVTNEKWETISTEGLPEKAILSVKGYPKSSDGSNGSRLIVLMSDNTIWWYAEGSGWSMIPDKGLMN